MADDAHAQYLTAIWNVINLKEAPVHVGAQRLRGCQCQVCLNADPDTEVVPASVSPSPSPSLTTTLCADVKRSVYAAEKEDKDSLDCDEGWMGSKRSRLPRR